MTESFSTVVARSRLVPAPNTVYISKKPGLGEQPGVISASEQCSQWPEVRLGLPCNLLIFSLPRFNLAATIVHLVDVTGVFLLVGNVALNLGYRLEGIVDVLVIHDLANHFCRLRSFVEVYEVRVLDYGRDALLDEDQISQVYSFTRLEETAPAQ